MVEQDDPRVAADAEERRTPRWVKVFAIVALVVALVAVVVALVGGGPHGPGRHGVPAAAVHAPR